MLGFLPIRVFVKGVLSDLVELLLRVLQRFFHRGLFRGFLFGQFALAFGGHAIAFANLLLGSFLGELFFFFQKLDGPVGVLQLFFQYLGLVFFALFQSFHILLRKIARTGRDLLHGEAFETFGDVRNVVLLRAGLHDIDVVLHAGEGGVVDGAALVFVVALRAGQSFLCGLRGGVVAPRGVEQVQRIHHSARFLRLAQSSGGLFRRGGGRGDAAASKGVKLGLGGYEGIYRGVNAENISA